MIASAAMARRVVLKRLPFAETHPTLRSIAASCDGCKLLNRIKRRVEWNEV
jgi:hypothetical protein